MKHFLIEIDYTAPIEIINTLVTEHRAFLQTGYDKGWLLMSGPKNPKIGGIVIARAPSMQEIQTFFFNDPYQQHNAATYRFVEFEPVKSQALLADWLFGNDIF
jgi:uncharacterized protein YciI